MVKCLKHECESNSAALGPWQVTIEEMIDEAQRRLSRRTHDAQALLLIEARQGEAKYC